MVDILSLSKRYIKHKTYLKIISTESKTIRYLFKER